MIKIIPKLLTAFLLIGMSSKPVTAQSTDTTLNNLTSLQNNFVSEIKSFGITPRLAAPKIVIDNPRSFGNYDDSLNVLHTSIWQPQPDEAKDFFNSLAKQLGNGETGEDVFNKAAHQWIFTHEMGHWWRTNNKMDTLPFDEETAANRIAIAYWREHDVKFMTFMMAIFQNVVNTLPSPVPAGQSERDYFNKNYNALPGGAAYSWYQSKMIVNAYNEKPMLTFKQAVTNSGYTKLVVK
jgi:hypothetical protein